MKKERTRNRRRLRRALLLLAAMPLLVVTVLVLSLRLEIVRHALLERLGVAVHERTGWRLEIDDATFRPLLGDVLIRGLHLAPPGEDRPLLIAEQASIRIVLTSLFDARLRLRTLAVDSPRVDLDLLPQSQPEGDEPAPDFELPIDIDRLLVRGGIVHAAPGEAAAGWADEVQLENLELNGALRSDRIDLRLASRLGIDGPRLGRREATVGARVTGTLAELHVPELTLDGSGLDLNAELRLGLTPDAPLEGSFDLTADLTRLLDREAGWISGRGYLDVRRRTGALDATVAQLPGSLLAPWIPAEVADRYRLDSTRVDGEAKIRAESGAPLAGSLRLEWLRDDDAILQARAEVRDARIDWDREPRFDTLEGTLALEAEALPAEIVGPWMGGPESRAALAGGSLDLDLKAALRAGVEDLLTAEGALSWQGRDDGRLDLRLLDLAAQANEDGALDPSSLTGSVAAEARDVPAELLLPWIGGEIFQRLGAARTTFDLAAELGLRRTRTDPLAAEIGATWSTGEQKLLVASLRSVASRRRADGRLDPDSVALGIELEAPGMQGERLAVALGHDLAETLAVAGTRLEASASAVVDRNGFAGDGGHARARWIADDGVELLTASADTRGGDTIALVVAAELLPAAEGSRRAGGTIRADRWTALADATVEKGTLDIRIPDLQSQVEALRAHWPMLAASLPLSEGNEAPSIVEEALRGEVTANLTLAGPLTEIDMQLDARWLPHPGSQVLVTGTGRPFQRTGNATLRVEGLSLQILTPQVSGLIEATLEASAEGSGWTAAIELTADGLELKQSGVALDALSLAAATDGSGVRLDSLVARHRGTRLEASGALAFALPPDWAELTFAIEDPDGGLEYVAVDLTLADGVARLESRDLRSRLGPGSLVAVAPLAALAQIEGLPAFLADAWRSPDSTTTVSVDVLLPVLDSQDLAPFVTTTLPWRILGEDIRLALELEPQELSAARGSLEVGDLRLETAEHSVATQGPLRLRLARRRLDLTPIRATVDARPFDIRGHAELEQSRLAIADLRLTATANVDLGLLDPILLGGVGSGPLAVEARLGGSPEALDGRLVLDGRGGRIDFLSPYVSRFADPHLEMTLIDGGVQITEATARLNEGALDASGSWTGDTGLFLATAFENVRYRLDYGLSALLDGTLELRLPLVEDRRGSIQGELVVQRGLVRRDVNLERELLRQLLAADLEGADTSGDDIDLDIRLVSRQGIRVRNNVADLRATWPPIQIRGTLAEPTIDGTVEIDPGGLVFAYGQTLRIDRGTLTLRAEPGAEPILDLVTTASYEDPSIARRDPSQSLDPFAGATQRTGEQIDRTEAAALGLADYMADRIAAGTGELLSSPLAGTGLTIRPVVVFNESDPSARLTVGRDLTENLTLAVSINMRQAEQRTYLLQVEDLPGLPRLQGQIFTNEQANRGATLQQTLSFGGDREMRVGKVRIDLPPESGLDARALRRAISIARRDPLPEGIEFDTEIEVSDALRRRGYYSANIAVTATEAQRSNRTDILVEVAPGPRTEVVFEGDRPPNRRRSAIATLYRSDYYESASLEEMRSQMRRALRSEGYLDPTIDILVERGDGDGSVAQRIVITAAGGRRVDPQAPRFPELEAEIESRLQQRFSTRQARIELAAEEEGARSTVRSVLRNFGHPKATILGLALSEDGKDLTVHVDPGPRQTVHRIEITGVDQERARQLAGLLTLAAEDPVHSGRLAQQAIALEDELRGEGFSDARVRTVTRPAEPAGEAAAAEIPEHLPTVVEFRVDPGPRYRLAEVELEGARKTRQGWAMNVAGLKEGETFTRLDLLDLRRRLYQTGIFSSVYVDTRMHEDGDITLIIGVDERPPVSVGYGLRWESDEGAGIVVDVLNRNSLGRGIALGARALYTQDTQFGRIYSDLPYVLGTRNTLETFIEIRDELDEQDLPREEFLTSVQLARSFGRYTTGRTYARYLRQLTVIDDPFFGRFEDVLRSPALGVQYIFNRRSDPLSGRSGLFASADLSGSGDFLGSDREYLRFFGQLNLYRPAGQLWGRRLGWAQSFRLGAVDAFDDQPLADEDAFRAGGAYSIRGYPTESLGPRDPFTGREIGGNALLVLNEELHFPIVGRFTGLIFLDTGNVWESPGDVDLDLFSAVGTGLRVDSPIGLLRLDVAFPLDRRDGDPTFKVYVGFGNVF